MLDALAMVILGIIMFWLIGSTGREECKFECNCPKCRNKNLKKKLKDGNSKINC